MAPEAIIGGDQLDGRSDLYSLAAVGYYLLTGTNVFEGKTIMEVCAHHLHTPPERPSVRLGLPVPADVEVLLLKCLAKTPADRPADARSLMEALGETAAAHEWSQADAAGWWSVRGGRAGQMARGKMPLVVRDDAIEVRHVEPTHG
jgi:serine/threonine-protein kinase